MKYISGLWDIHKKCAEFRICKTNHVRIRYLSFNTSGIRYFRILFLPSRWGIEEEKDTELRDLEPLQPSLLSMKMDLTDRLPSKLDSTYNEKKLTLQSVKIPHIGRCLSSWVTPRTPYARHSFSKLSTQRKKAFTFCKNLFIVPLKEGILNDYFLVASL